MACASLCSKEKERKESKERRAKESEENRAREFPASDKERLLAKEKKEKPVEIGFFREINGESGHGRDRGEEMFPEKRSVADLERACATHQAWIEAVAMKNSIAVPRALEWLRAFRLHMEASGRSEETEREFKRYFANWTASEIRQGRAPINAPAPQTPGTNGKMDPTQAMQMALIRKYGKTGNGHLAIGG